MKLGYPSSAEVLRYATRMSADDIRSAVVTPNKDLDPRRGLVSVILADSTTLSGMARNAKRSRQGLAALILYIHIQRDLNFNYRRESALFADTNPRQGPEVPLWEVREVPRLPTITGG